MKKLLCLLACISAIFFVTACNDNPPPPQTVSVTLDLCGGSITGSQTYTATVGSDLVIETPTKTGYEFGGWEYNGTIVALTPFNLTDSSVTLKAVWNANEYQVYLDVNGGTLPNGVEANFAIDYGTSTKDIKDIEPTKTGYEFVGWLVDGVSISNFWNYISDAPVILTAQYNPNYYHAVLNLNGGAVDNGIELDYIIAYDSSTEDIKNITPTKIGHTFNGWLVNGNALNDTWVYDSESEVVLTASFTPKTYPVFLGAVGGVLPSGTNLSFSVEYGASTQSVKDLAPVKTGYNFKYWTVNGQELNDYWDYDVSGTITVIATYTPKTYQAVLDVNGGVLPSGTNVNFNIDYASSTQSIKAVVPTRIGYRFGGWAINDTPIGEYWMTDSQSATTVKAVWNAKNYQAGLDANGGELPSGIQVNFNIDYDSSTQGIKDIIPTKKGYTFNCWLVNGEALTDKWNYDSETAVLLTADYLLNSYSVTVDVDGGTLETGAVTEFDISYGGATTDITNIVTTKKGYTFDGWVVGDVAVGEVWDFDGAKEYTVKALWKPITLKYVFIVEDGSVEPLTGEILYDASTDEINQIIPTKTGYTFRAWKINGEDIGEKFSYLPLEGEAVIDIYADFTAKTYQVSLTVENGVLPEGASTEFTITYAQSGTLPVLTSNDSSKIFIGWKSKDNDNLVTDINGAFIWNYDFGGELVPEFSKDEIIVFRHYDGFAEMIVIPDGGSITLEDIPTPRTMYGYNAKWEIPDDDIITLNKTTEIKAIITPENCTLYYVVNGEEVYTVQHPYNSIVKFPVMPQIDGYELLGWSLSQTDSSEYYSGAVLWQTLGSTTLYGVYEPKTYTVTYDVSGVNSKYFNLKDADGNDVELTQTVKYNADYKLYVMNVINNVATVTWVYNGEELNSQSVWKLTEDVVVTPKLNYSQEGVTLNIDLNGGTGSQTATIIMGNKVYGISPAPVAPNGKTLIGYTYKDEFIKLNSSFEILDYDGTALVANYVDSATITVNVDVNGGQGATTATIGIGERFTTIKSKPIAPQGTKLVGFRYKGEFYYIGGVFDITDYDGTALVAEYVSDSEDWSPPV